IMSVILATLALAMCGCLVAVLAYMPPGKKITEMILIGWVAALVTYGIGRAASVFLGMEV
ncbi:MAG: VIT1/CCC1 transporter family protein, partial [candidate division WOR-3 bacterium]